MLFTIDIQEGYYTFIALISLLFDINPQVFSGSHRRARVKAPVQFCTNPHGVVQNCTERQKRNG